MRQATGFMRVSSTRGVTIHVHELGGAGEPLLICHATGFCGRAYEPLAAVLAGRFRVWSVDFRGHGLSGAPADGDYSWDRMADDVLAAAQALSPRGIRVLGHSMGGGAALLAESRRPGTLAAAYLFEPAILRASDPSRAAAMAEQTRRRAAVFASRAEARDRLKSRPAYATWRDDALDAFVEHGLADLPDGRVALRCSPEHEAACYLSPTTSIADVTNVRIPVAIAAGLEPDVFGAELSARELSAAIPHARLVEHPGLGHFGPFEDPVGVGRAAITALADGAGQAAGRYATPGLPREDRP
jgi:pimeloyl-ACP methyl ester carboxylesterase